LPAKLLRILSFGSVKASEVDSHESCADSHKGVYVNGVDQGTFKGIRIPAYNGAPGKGGFNNSPVKDLTSIDLRCNVMGDIQAHDTIKVAPGDNLTFDWCDSQKIGSIQDRAETKS
tara:strand:+ start:8227 stop:8574 length:348 start_codon:yes stop_codon:yes gene_type:complete